MENIYENKHFDVVVTTRMAAEEGDNGLVYAMINKKYGVREHEAYAYVEIIRVADAASEAIDELLKEKEDRPVLELASIDSMH